ncbi:damage-inducible protein DinB [Deinococcus sp. HMF7620]|uniref:Damage-inducible protein DinB n=1 Tax=Deinococcus arboris TaxID=2682977 RepID=A0A7C9M8A1_9DEIO|nr:DinB family protein [Deinococcus arboris]MVN88445.1 damage-inducible protein DinB [Deinococcus arboris]
MTLTADAVLSLSTFLPHWQGHRALTRRTIEAFPEGELFTFTPAPPMRPFGQMAGELLFVSAMTLDGLRTGEWPEPDWSTMPQTKADLLAAWDALSDRLAAEWSGVKAETVARLQPLPWGEMPGWVAAMYAVDNEIHHRGQGYVYLRALGQEPPAFYER